MTEKGAEQKRTDNSIIKIYLIIYNLVQAVCWIRILFRLIDYNIGKTSNTLFGIIKWPLLFSQIITILEIVHVKKKIVPSNIINTSIQVFLRIFITTLIMPTSSGHTSIGFPIAMHAWTATEMARYSFYTLNQVKAVPYFLKWLRYSIFMIAYPVGATGELLCLYAAQQEIMKSINHQANTIVSVDFLKKVEQIVIFGVMGAMVPILFKLYSHMLKQRRKVLNQEGVSVTMKNK